MRIAMVSEHASPLAVLGGVDAGGQNVHVAALSRALVGLGHEVDVYTRRDDGDSPDVVETDDGYRVVHVDAGPATVLPKDDLLPHMAQMGTQMAHMWTLRRPDVVHAHFWMSGLASHVAARDLDLPIVQTFHALGIVKQRHQGTADTSPKGRARFEASLARASARVVATSTDEVFELLRMGVPRALVSVVPCGVDIDHFTPAGAAAPRGDGFRVVCVGRLVERKGIDLLVRAVRHVPDMELVIAGGPDHEHLDADPEAGRLLDIARDAGVLEKVAMLGRVPRDELPALLRSADVVACTPWYEPFGIVPLEAMACGRPVLATAVGGLVDTVVDGVTGVLVPPRDTRALVTALRQMQQDVFALRGMGEAACERAQARYTWSRIASETEHVYDKVEQQRATRRTDAR